MEKKYFFFDIDGTLVVWEGDKTYIPQSAKEALNRLRESGHFVAIATGRSSAMAFETMDMLGVENMVTDGGNGLVIDRKLAHVKPLDRDKCIALIRECEEKHIPWAFSPDNTTRRIAPNNDFTEYTHDTYMATEVVTDFDINHYPEIYKVYVACHEPEEKKIEALKELPWYRYLEPYIFVEPADKGAGIRRMIKLIGGDTKEVVVFGDNENDLTMFSPEWTNIAMGNAVPELKKAADYVTDSCDKDGIYNACRHFGWI